ncbi:MAG TPA: hypothetical protein VJB89_04265 [Candidatus Nanoarchaeia archaeon]|nr:hypothetical protein [Candidatus Nanoarchaeia archaeon]
MELVQILKLEENIYVIDREGEIYRVESMYVQSKEYSYLRHLPFNDGTINEISGAKLVSEKIKLRIIPMEIF